MLFVILCAVMPMLLRSADRSLLVLCTTYHDMLSSYPEMFSLFHLHQSQFITLTVDEANMAGLGRGSREEYTEILLAAAIAEEFRNGAGSKWRKCVYARSEQPLL